MASDAERKAIAKRNVELGWCPCGLERDFDCECFGVRRLSMAQGARDDIIRRSAAVSETPAPPPRRDDERTLVVDARTPTFKLDIRGFKPEPGEVIVVAMPEETHAEVFEAVQKFLQRTFPDNRRIVMHENVTLGTWKAHRVAFCSSCGHFIVAQDGTHDEQMAWNCGVCDVTNPPCWRDVIELPEPE